MSPDLVRFTDVDMVETICTESQARQEDPQAQDQALPEPPQDQALPETAAEDTIPF